MEGGKGGAHCQRQRERGRTRNLNVSPWGGRKGVKEVKGLLWRNHKKEKKKTLKSKRKNGKGKVGGGGGGGDWSKN